MTDNSSEDVGMGGVLRNDLLEEFLPRNTPVTRSGMMTSLLVKVSYKRQANSSSGCVLIDATTQSSLYIFAAIAMSNAVIHFRNFSLTVGLFIGGKNLPEVVQQVICSVSVGIRKKRYLISR